MNIFNKDKKYLWHPFTQMADWLHNNITIIKKARGSYLFDTRDKKYLDGVSSLWCNVHGHQAKEINLAIKKQLSRVSHSTMLGLSNIPAITLAEKLINMAPNRLTRVFYSDNGSTAVEIALKIAFQYHQQLKNNSFKLKTKFLTFSHSYHGDTIGSVSLGGIALFHKTYHPLLFKTIKAPAPYCYRCPMNQERARCQLKCLNKTAQLIKQHHKKLAGVIIEPLVQGAAGMITQPTGFIRKIRQLCDQYNILMIADEVATGFGRTGRMFACEHENISPDIMTVAKGITGGYLPLAATLTTEKIFAAFLGRFTENKTFFHGHTYTGNPLACSAAIASLKIFKQNRTIDKLQSKITTMSKELSHFTQLPHVGDIRQCGFMAGIELVRNKKNKEGFTTEKRVGHKVILEAHNRGIILRPLGDVIVLMPPLSISPSELKVLLKTTYESIECVTTTETHKT